MTAESNAYPTIKWVEEQATSGNKHLLSDPSLMTRICQMCKEILSISKFEINKKTGKPTRLTCFDCRNRDRIEHKRQSLGVIKPQIVKVDEPGCAQVGKKFHLDTQVALKPRLETLERVRGAFNSASQELEFSDEMELDLERCSNPTSSGEPWGRYSLEFREKIKRKSKRLIVKTAERNKINYVLDFCDSIEQVDEIFKEGTRTGFTDVLKAEKAIFQARKLSHQLAILESRETNILRKIDLEV